MMKKLLVVLMVLAIATAANAVTIKLVVNDILSPPDTAITLRESETASIDILMVDNTGWAGSFMGILLVTSPLNAGHITNVSPDPEVPAISKWEQSNINHAAKPEPYQTYYDFLIGAYPNIQQIIEWAAMDTVEPFLVPGNGQALLDHIMFHCDLGSPPNDVKIILLDAEGTYLDQAIIHQVPEPMTLALLGLGGLLLRRRK